jgi:beta-phosphoglucomutase family hydrolase
VSEPDAGPHGPPTPVCTIDTTRYDAVVFDMDGVITDTARIHQRAWKRLFDGLLAEWTTAGADRRPFTTADYLTHVDGRARIDGTTDFLRSRGIDLPVGEPGDGPGERTAWGLANAKNSYFHEALAVEGAHVFPSSESLLRELRAVGLRTAVVTASRNRAEVLAAAGVDDLFDAHVDGNDAAELGLPGKPDPALFTEAARRLQVAPPRAAVVEDATAGVEAARRGGFGLVIGVDRQGRPRPLYEHGADVVVEDLAQIRVSLSCGGPEPAPRDDRGAPGR